jgi:hypothetical protein
MKKWIATSSLIMMSSTSFGFTLAQCEKEVLNLAQTGIDLKVNAYKIKVYDAKTGAQSFLGGNLQPNTLKQISASNNAVAATVQAEDIGSYYEVEVKVGPYCDLMNLNIKDLGQK